MTGSDNADVKWRENNVEGEDSWRTANCLRGRLLAERMASRNAREEAEQLGIRLLEVESLLKQEAKSRNKAERKLKLLMKRVECMNISYESEQSVESSSKGSLNMEESNESQLSLWSSTSSFEFKNEPSAVEMNSQRVESSVDEEEDPCLMALVPVNVAVEDRRIDLDATVKEALESLRRAKEQLQRSMERRRMSMSMSMIKVG